MDIRTWLSPDLLHSLPDRAWPLPSASPEGPRPLILLVLTAHLDVVLTHLDVVLTHYSTSPVSLTRILSSRPVLPFFIALFPASEPLPCFPHEHTSTTFCLKVTTTR